MKTSFIFTVLLSMGLSSFSVAQSSKESAARTELKQSVAKMSYETGDRRVLILDGKLLETYSAPSALPNGNVKKQKSKKGDTSITVQCSPLGEAESIGGLKKKKNNALPKAQGEALDIFAPAHLDMPEKNWHRIAQLACQEAEI